MWSAKDWRAVTRREGGRRWSKARKEPIFSATGQTSFRACRRRLFPSEQSGGKPFEEVGLQGTRVPGAIPGT